MMSDPHDVIPQHLQRIEEHPTRLEEAQDANAAELRGLVAGAERGPRAGTVNFMGGMGTTIVRKSREQ